MEEMKRRQAEQAEQREEAMARVHTLSHSEFKVFRLLGLGLTNQEIAESLHISTLTVRSHMKKIHAKCGIKERTRLALSAYQACHLELGAGEKEERAAPEVARGGFAVSGLPAVPVGVHKNGGGGSAYARYGSLS